MTEQCPRCLSSSFALLSNGRCTFCVGHFDFKYSAAEHRMLVAALPIAHVKTRFDGEPPSILNGRDRTTSGVIGQP